MPTRSFRTTDALDRQIQALQLAGFGNVTRVVTTAIDRMYRDECSQAQPVRRIEVWQHRTSGERYAVLVDRGRPIAASGPLYYEDTDKIMAGESDIAWDEAQADAINTQEESGDEEVYRRIWPEPSA